MTPQEEQWGRFPALAAEVRRAVMDLNRDQLIYVNGAEATDHLTQLKTGKGTLEIPRLITSVWK